MEPKLAVSIGKLKLSNPVVVASGTFGYGEEFADFLDLKSLGAIVTKTITVGPRRGNLPPRTCETPSGMLNSIGLENPGIDRFIEEKLPYLKQIGVPIIVSIASQSRPDEFVEVARRLDKLREVSAVELNISCPNLSHTKLIAQDARATFELVKSVRKATGKTLITKLSPNVTCIADIAVAAEEAGSDAVSLINTLTGMSIDIERRTSRIASVTGGLSGPCIRPVAVRMVYEVYQKIKIPIIGMGGIIDLSSALEFILAGATAISIGTANFVEPSVSIQIIKGLRGHLIKNKLGDIRHLKGALKL